MTKVKEIRYLNLFEKNTRNEAGPESLEEHFIA
jgi:hypothetical protein